MVKSEVNAKEIWLTYFNKVLHDKGLISDMEYRKMNSLILQRCHCSKSK